MSQATIRAEFESRLATWAAGRGYPVAWENRAFSPPANGPYLRSNLLPASLAYLDLAAQSRQFAGVYQVGIILPGGGGPGLGDTLAAELNGVFPTGGVMVRAGLRIWVTRPMSPAPAINEDDGRYFLPVSCTYEALVA